MTTPEPDAVPEVDDLDPSPDAWANPRDTWNTGLIEPHGTVEEEALRRMDAEVHEDYGRRADSDRADAAYCAWAQAHPEEAAARQAEARAASDDPDPWAAEYDVEPEAGLLPPPSASGYPDREVAG